MSYKARTFTREEFRKVIAAAIYDYEQAPAKCLYTPSDWRSRHNFIKTLRRRSCQAIR